jgi:hypothetical protein
MDAANCEVIGCSQVACWVLVAREHLHSEDYLCDRHWNLLYLRTPEIASHYALLPSLLAGDADLPIGAPAEIDGHAQCLIAYTGEPPLPSEQPVEETLEVRTQQAPCTECSNTAPERLAAQPPRGRRSVKKPHLVG